MNDLVFDKATPEERDELGRVRALAWAGKITAEQFVGRNRRLYQHEYGRTQIETYVLRRKAKEIVSSMDVLSVPMLVKRPGISVPNNTMPSSIREEEGFLIASVITPPELRGNQFAATLLKSFFEQNRKTAGVLYSDIGPDYYERFGFHENFCWTIAGQARTQTNHSQAERLSLAQFTTKLMLLRMQALEKAKTGSACLRPDALFLDWQLDRYRYFSTLVEEHKGSKGDLEPQCFEIHHSKNNASHLALLCPHSIYQQVEVLWCEPRCVECLEFLSFQTSKWSFDKFYYWDCSPSSKATKQECPMIRIDGINQAHFLDPQLCDWW